MRRCVLVVILLILLAGCAQRSDPLPPAGRASAHESSFNSTGPETRLLFANTTTCATVGIPTEHTWVGCKTDDAPFNIERGEPTSGAMIAHWNATTPASAQMYVLVGDLDNNTVIAQGEGTSPLSIPLPSGLHKGDYAVRVYPSAGVTVMENVAFVVTLNYS